MDYQLNSATMVATLREQEEREMIFFEAEVASMTEDLVKAETQGDYKRIAEDMKNAKDAHRERIFALRQAQSAYSFGFQLDNAHRLTTRALAFILQEDYDSNVSIPVEKLEDENPVTHIVLDSEEVTFFVRRD